MQAFCDNPDNCAEQCFPTIMAWGGMNVHHGTSAWKRRAAWLPIVEAMRAGNLSRWEAYERFRRFRADNPGCGMGPAFFTKLIFFLNRRERGYIMDQWTGLSVNLLFEPAIVDMNFIGGERPAHVVSDNNSGAHYERFCQAIECLAKRTGWPAELVEERLFCNGGRRRGPWRQYVITHRPNAAIRVPVLAA